MAKYKLTEKELGDILRAYQEITLQALPLSDDADVEVTKKSRQRVKRLVWRVRKPRYWFAMTWIRITATAAIVGVVLLATAMLTIEPLRNSISDIFRNNTNNVSFIHVDNDVANANRPGADAVSKGFGFVRTDHLTLTSFQVDPIDVVNTPKSIVERYVVDLEVSDYVIMREEVNDDYVLTNFIRETTQDEILFIQATKQRFVAEIEMADAQVFDIVLNNGMIGLSVTGKNGIYLILQNEDYAFLILAASDADELMRFAETLSMEAN